MPQLFQVLRCYKCSVFQVHQTRKDNKWICKLCGEKQSVKRHYGTGTGKDCRLHVQKLNIMRGENDEAKFKTFDSEESENDEIIYNETKENILKQNSNTQSKWSTFVDDAQINNEKQNESMHLDDIEVVLELPQKRKVKRNHNNNNKCAKQPYYNADVANSKGFKNILDHNITCTPSLANVYENETLYPEQKSFQTKKPKQKPKNESSVPIIQKCDKLSKWAQFVEDDADMNDSCEVLMKDSKQESKAKLFSLCDDNDLDNVLNI